MSLRWSWTPLIAFACASSTPPTATPPTAAPPVTSGALPSADVVPQASVVVLVRHGEKTGNEPDAGLSDLGRARAQCLANMLVDAGVRVTLSSEMARTRDTVEPTATRAAVAVEAIAAADQAAWLHRMRHLPPGTVALAAAHSNTLPPLIWELSGREVKIGHDDYDRMFIITMVGERASNLLTLRYCQTAPPR